MGRRSAYSLAKFSSFTLTCVLFLISFYLDCHFIQFGACSKLRLVPGAIYPPNFQIYRFLTFFLVNSSLILLTLDILGFFVFDIFVFNRWNFAERVKYLLMCSWIPGLLCLVYYYIKFANSKTEADIYATYVSGSSAFAAAVFVAVKQLSSEPMGGRYWHFLHHYSALVYLSVILLLSLFEVIPPITCLYSFLGFLVGWTYLRFAQKHTDGQRGDFRASFAFVKFFPPFVQPVLAIPVNLIYAVVVAFGLCPKVGQQYEIISASTFASTDIARAGFSPKDHYKRIALESLNARLSQKAPASEPLEAWPALDEDYAPSQSGSNTLESSQPLLSPPASTTNVSLPQSLGAAEEEGRLEENRDESALQV